MTKHKTKARTLSAAASNDAAKPYVELDPNAKLPVILPPVTAVSDDVSNIVKLASDMATQAASFSADVTSTLLHIREQISIIDKHFNDMRSYFDDRLKCLHETQLEELNELRDRHENESLTLQSTMQSSLELCASMRQILLSLETKFSSNTGTNSNG